jgi:hypothetical protein
MGGRSYYSTWPKMPTERLVTSTLAFADESGILVQLRRAATVCEFRPAKTITAPLTWLRLQQSVDMEMKMQERP